MKVFELKMRLIAPLFVVCCFVCLGSQSAQAQLTESFEGGVIPASWTLSPGASTYLGPTGGVSSSITNLMATNGTHFAWITNGCQSGLGDPGNPNGCNNTLGSVSTFYGSLYQGPGTNGLPSLQGLGSPTVGTTLRSPAFTIGAGGGTVSFDVNFLTSDGTYDFPDFATVQLVPTGDNPAITLFVANTTCDVCRAVPPVGLVPGVGTMSTVPGDVSVSTESPVDFSGLGVTLSNTSYGFVAKFGGGNGGPTGWIHVSFSAPADTYTLLFTVSHAGDQNYASALAIDNITTPTQTQTLGPPGTTATFTFNTDTYKITGVNNTGAEQLTVTAVPVPQSSVPVGSIILFPNETCVPYRDYSADFGVDTCVEFQATCTGTDCGSNGTFVYQLATGYDLPPDLADGIGGPDFLAFHGVGCPPPAGSVPESIFLSYEQNARDPVTKGGGRDLTCFVATYVPTAAPVTTASVNGYYVGFQDPIKNLPAVNRWEEFFFGQFPPIPLIGQVFDATNTLVKNPHFFSFCSPNTPLANCPANSMALQFVPISCTTLAATGGAATRANALFNSVLFNPFNNSNTFIVLALPPRSFDNSCQALQLVITGSPGAQSTHTALFKFD
jgi:hypothetical protein